MMNKVNSIKSSNILLEPINFSSELPGNCLIAKSLHKNDNEIIYCNVTNMGDDEFVLKTNNVVGEGCEVMDESNGDEELVKAELENFNNEVKKYKVPCLKWFLEKVKHRVDAFYCNNTKVVNVGKTCASKPVPPGNVTVENFITIKDVLAHEVKAKLKELRLNQKLSIEQKACLVELILGNVDVFRWNDKEIGETKLAVHSVPTETKQPPIVQRQYQIHSAAKPSLLQQTKDMLEMNVIRESNSTWRSPVLLVRKKADDGSIQYRFCIDLKKVNSVTAKDCYALPLIQETVDALNGAKFFTTLDVDRAFWQVPVLEKDRKKLAFVVDGKLYEFNVMPFGSMNAPSTFQRLIDRVLRGLTWRQCLVYIDDVLIFSKTFEQHVLDVDEVMHRFRLAGLKLKPSKCKFGMQEVDYLGFKITQNGIRVSDKKIDAILRLKPPETNKLLYSFLCGINYYRSLIPKFGDLTVELYKMALDRKRKCLWNGHLLKCFETLRQAIICAPVLAFPDFGKEFVINTDASADAISGVLLQKHGSIWKPVSFFSRKLTPAEKRYSASEREMLAVRESYFNFIHLVFDRKITFKTDHEPLVTAHRLKNPLGRLAKFFNDLVDVNYTMEYIEGKNNYLPDFLSRAATVDVSEIEANLTVVKSNIKWGEEQEKCSEIRELMSAVLQNKERSEWYKFKNGRRWWNERHSLFISNGVLLHSQNKIICPEHLRGMILKTHHDVPLAGHRSAETSVVSIRANYFWFGLNGDVVDYCSSCPKCQMFNYANLQNVAPLKSIIVNRPFQLIGMDFMGPFKRSKSGNLYIFLVIDHWTKFAVGVALPSFNAEATARALIDNVVCKYGMFEKVLSDQGVNFESNLMKHVCTLLGVEKLHTTTYNAAGNGITERLNKTIKPNLAKYVNDDHSDWDEFLQLAVAAYNSANHASTGMSPYEALFARPPVNVIDLIIGNELPEDTKRGNVSEFVKQLKLQALRINGTAQAKQKHYHDKFVRDAAEYRVGDKVKINNYRARINRSKAFEPKFLGPYEVTKICGDLTYEINNGKTPLKVHYKRMHKYHERNEIWNDEASSKVQIVGLGRSISEENDTICLVSERVTRAATRRRIAREREEHDNVLVREQLVERERLFQLRLLNLQNNFDVNEQRINRFRELERSIILEDQLEHEQGTLEISFGMDGIRNLEQQVEPWLVEFNELVIRDNYINYERDLTIRNITNVINLETNNLQEEEVADQDIELNSGFEQEYVSATESESESDNDGNLNDNVVLNDKGKITVECERCGKRCEEKYGLRAHQRFCTGVENVN